jgi:hypothetical protein
MKNQNLLYRLPVVSFTLLAFVLMSLPANAQLFTRTTFNAAYVPITTGGGATVSTATGNDVNQTDLPLGFTFNYAGVNYTTVGLNTNGLLWFDAVAPSAAEGAYNNNMYVSGAGGTDKSISAWWSDMTDDASSDILYQTKGTAGSQTFTVEYTNYPHYTGTVGTNIRLNYQVIFYEGTNIIEFRYGTTTGAGPAATAGGACIGIEYGTGGAGNFIDAVTGSSLTAHGMLSPLLAWPSYNFRFTPGAPTPVAGGTYNVGVGQTYPSLTQATADLNHRGISGPVTLNLTDANYDVTPSNGDNIFPIFVGPVRGTTASNTLTISKTGNPATLSYSGSPVTQGGFGCGSTGGLSAISDSDEPILGVCARYATISNISLVSLGTTINDVEIGLMVFESFGGDSGAQHNLFDKITVNMDRTNTNTIGIFSNNMTNPGGLAGSNSFNTYRDIIIRDCYAGINLEGAGGVYTFDTGNQIISSSCTSFNSIGDPDVPNDIGGNSTTYGIWLQSQSNFTVKNNIIRNVSSTSASSSLDGILVTSGSGTCEISNNIIKTIKRNNAGLGGSFILTGIRISHASTAEFRVFNNSISELLTSYTGIATANRAVRGIYFDDTGTGTITHNIWNNSISIDGSTFPNASSTCMELLDGKDLTFIVKNNVFANFTTAQTGVASHYIIVTTEADRYGLIASLFDYNDWYIANDQGTSGHIGLGSATKYSTLAAWKTGMSFNTGTDANSVSANPFFANNNTNLHGSSLSVSIDGAGTTPPAFITTDIDCQLRTAPHDIGFDDFIIGCIAEGGVITPASITLCAKDKYTMSSTGYTDDPAATYQWMISTTSGGPYSNVVDGTGATTPSYETDKLKKGTFYYVMQTTCPSQGTDLSNELVLDVKAFPTATITPAGPFNLCKGESVLLTAPNDPNRSYQWEKKNEDIAGATNMVFEASTKGNYKVTVTNITTGCKNTSAAVKINVYDDPVATITPQGPTTFCEGGSVVLQANTGAGLAYKWRKGSNYISGATLSSYTATTQGNYKVEVTDANGCTKTSEVTEVTVPCKLGKGTRHEVTIYPNPASAEVNISLPAGEDFDVELISVTGERIFRAENQSKIDLSNLAAGIYFIQISTADYITMQKLIKQ